jgi:hypothetical protein
MMTVTNLKQNLYFRIKILFSFPPLKMAVRADEGRLLSSGTTFETFYL